MIDDMTTDTGTQTESGLSHTAKSTPNMLTVGQILKKAREEKGFSRQDITNYLKMRPRIVIAIEDSLYKELPDVTSMVGLIKSYSRYLHLNGDELAHMYRAEVQGITKTIDIEFPEMLPQNFKLSRMAVLASVICIGILVIWNMQNFFGQDDSVMPVNTALNNSVPDNIAPDNTDKNDTLQKTDIPDDLQAPPAVLSYEINNTQQPLISKNIKQTEKLNAELGVKNSDTDIVSVDNKKPDNHIIISAVRGDSWIEITDKNRKTLFSGLLYKGKTFTLDGVDSEKARLKTGNASAIDILVGDKNTHIFGNNEAVVKNIDVDIKTLSQKIKPDSATDSVVTPKIQE